MTNAPISLKNILVPSKDVEVDYPGLDGFKVQICFLSRENMQKIRTKATKHTFKNRVPVATVDDDLFLELYVKAIVKGWTGLTVAHLETLAPIEMSGLNPDDEVAFSEENALYLVKNSVAFDSFITETANDLANFSTTK